MDRLQRFGEWAADLELEDVPDDVVERTELQMASQVAAANASDDLPDDVDPYTRVWSLATASVEHDYDDYLFAAHSGHSAVWTSVAACVEREASPEDLLESVVVANELEGRLGASAFVGPHNGQMWAFLHAAGAAAVTARLDGDAEAIADAVGVALYSPNHPNEAGFMDGDAKRYTAAAPAAAGMRYGEDAAEGVRRSGRALTGFLDSYSYLPAPEFLEGWGEAWVSRSLSYKPRPGCAYVQAPLEGWMNVVDGGVEPEDVDGVRVDAPLPAVGMEGLSGRHRPDDRLSGVSVNFSVAYTIALHAVEGEVSADALDRDSLSEREDDLRDFAGDVELRHDWSGTLDVLRGVGDAVDVGALLSSRGRVERMRALRRMREAHDTVPTRREALRLVRGRQTRAFLDALGGSLDWNEFDIARAEFDDLRFGFGARVEVDVDDETYVEEVGEHRGATGRAIEETREVVEDKFEREVGDGFGVFEDVAAADVDDVTGFL